MTLTGPRKVTEALNDTLCITETHNREEREK
jgi:hypothetical protein